VHEGAKVTVEGLGKRSLQGDVGFADVLHQMGAEMVFGPDFITIRGKTGTINLRFESVPSPDNPKTAMLACYSALAAFRQFTSPVRYGT